MKNNFEPLQDAIISEMIEDDLKNNSLEINIKENTRLKSLRELKLMGKLSIQRTATVR